MKPALASNKGRITTAAKGLQALRAASVERLPLSASSNTASSVFPIDPTLPSGLPVFLFSDWIPSGL